MHPLRFFQDNFASSCRIWTVDGALERRGASASRAFGFSKKYLETKKLSRNNFCDLFFITRFWKIVLKIVSWKIAPPVSLQPCLALAGMPEKRYIRNEWLVVWRASHNIAWGFQWNLFAKRSVNLGIATLMDTMHKWHVFQEAQTDQSLTLLVYSYRCTDRLIMVSHETIFKTIFQNRVMKNKSQKLFRDNVCVF